MKHYWATDLPVNKGQSNFDEISYEYYRDRDVATEAFKSGAFDLRAENQSKRWATAYDFPALKEGKVKKKYLYRTSVRQECKVSCSILERIFSVTQK